MRRVVLAGVLATLLSGCVEWSEHSTTTTNDAAMASAYQDADVRAYNSVAGEDTTTKTIDIPSGTSKLTVKARYSVAGEADFVLKNPAGLAVREDHPDGAKSIDDERWAVVDNPVPGPWKLTLTVSGSCRYAFGAYF